MFFALTAPASTLSHIAAGRACALSPISSKGYPGSVLCPARCERLALGREDSS
jgi:hypothetical protein